MRIAAVAAVLLMAAGAADAALLLTNPADACKAHIEKGLTTRGWKDRGGADYGCTTPYKDLGPGYRLQASTLTQKPIPGPARTNPKGVAARLKTRALSRSAMAATALAPS